MGHVKKVTGSIEPDSPGARAELDQVRAEALDRLRGATIFALVVVTDEGFNDDGEPLVNAGFVTGGCGTAAHRNILGGVMAEGLSLLMEQFRESLDIEAPGG